MIKRYPLASFFALAYLITWPFHVASMIVADRAGIAIRDLELVRHPDLPGGTMSTNHFSSCGSRATWVSSAAIAAFVSLTPVA